MAERLDKNGLTEEQFLRQYDPDKYPKPMLTADIVVFRASSDKSEVRVLLVERKGHPYLGHWALPGGFAEPGETIEATAARELMEETSMPSADMTLVGVYSAPGRDPRGWVVSAAFAAVLRDDSLTAVAGDDAAQVGWFPLERGEDGVFRLKADPRTSPLAFDHDQILRDAAQAVLTPALGFGK